MDLYLWGIKTVGGLPESEKEEEIFCTSTCWQVGQSLNSLHPFAESHEFAPGKITNALFPKVKTELTFDFGVLSDLQNSCEQNVETPAYHWSRESWRHETLLPLKTVNFISPQTRLFSHVSRVHAATSQS